jgi:Na+-transporting NADH:ubiquinone oxidoreductase subunit NqrC
MMTKKIISLLLLIVFIVSLVSAGIIANDRLGKEAQAKQVELSVEYGQILEIARQGNYSYEEVLEELQLDLKL